MNTATIMDIAWEGAQLAFRAIMAARTRQDAEQLRDQLRALGPAQRSDVAGIEARALEGMQSRSDDKRRRVLAGESLLDERPRIAPDFPSGPLGEGE